MREDGEGNGATEGDDSGAMFTAGQGRRLDCLLVCKSWNQMTADGLTAIRLAKRPSAGVAGSHLEGFDLATIPLARFSSLCSLEVGRDCLASVCDEALRCVALGGRSLVRLHLAPQHQQHHQQHQHQLQQRQQPGAQQGSPSLSPSLTAAALRALCTHCCQLRDLSLEVVTASVPPELGLLTRLTSLRLASNDLRLSDSLLRLTRLRSLELSFNELAGIPDALFATHARLTRLHLQSSTLSRLPDSFSQLSLSLSV